MIVCRLDREVGTSNLESVVLFVFSDEEIFPVFWNLEGDVSVGSCNPLVAEVVSESEDGKSINYFLFEELDCSCETELARISWGPTCDNIGFLEPEFIIGVC